MDSIDEINRDSNTLLKTQLAAFADELRSIREWKDRQEQAKAERIAAIRNKVVDLFTDQGLNIDEILSVLGILEHEYREKFIVNAKGK